MELMLSIIGVFIALGLTVNAFFLRGIFADLGAVKVNIAEIFENSKNKDSRIDALEAEIKELKLLVRTIEMRCLNELRDNIRCKVSV